MQQRNLYQIVGQRLREKTKQRSMHDIVAQNKDRRLLCRKRTRPYGTEKRNNRERNQNGGVITKNWSIEIGTEN